MTLQTADNGLLPARWLPEFRRQAPAAARVRSAAARSDRDASQPVLPRGARMAISSGRPMPCAPSSGFSAATISSTPLVDLETGSCCDGLHPGRANENRGGESVVSYLLGLAEMRRLARCAGDRSEACAAARFHAAESINVRQRSRHLDTKHVLQQAGTAPAPRSGAGRCASIQAGDRAARSQSHRQDAREPHRRSRSGAGCRDGCQPAGRGPGELPRAAPQPARDLRGARG